MLFRSNAAVTAVTSAAAASCPQTGFLTDTTFTVKPMYENRGTQSKGDPLPAFKDRAPMAKGHNELRVNNRCVKHQEGNI